MNSKLNFKYRGLNKSQYNYISANLKLLNTARCSFGVYFKMTNVPNNVLGNIVKSICYIHFLVMKHYLGSLIFGDLSYNNLHEPAHRDEI